jgi:hypothetical protein
MDIYKLTQSERWQLERKISNLEERIKFLQGALLTVIEGGAVNENLSLNISVIDFYELYEKSMNDFFELEGKEAEKMGNKSINADMFLSWQGLQCNLGSGAVVWNDIVTNLPDLYEELFY